MYIFRRNVSSHECRLVCERPAGDMHHTLCPKNLHPASMQPAKKSLDLVRSPSKQSHHTRVKGSVLYGLLPRADEGRGKGLLRHPFWIFSRKKTNCMTRSPKDKSDYIKRRMVVINLYHPDQGFDSAAFRFKANKPFIQG